MGNLGLNWEGPYRVTSIAGTGAYRLEDLDERHVARPWNVSHLRSTTFDYYIRECALFMFSFIKSIEWRKTLRKLEPWHYDY